MSHPRLSLALDAPDTLLDAGTIALWAWGFHRVVDYLTQAPDLVDRRRIAAVGHSRNGKTALLAGAMDDRIALVIPHQAANLSKTLYGRVNQYLYFFHPFNWSALEPTSCVCIPSLL